jgi:hypothetical protein
MWESKWTGLNNGECVRIGKEVGQLQIGGGGAVISIRREREVWCESVGTVERKLTSKNISEEETKT